ncbi:hypothetical protein [Paraburkholderia sp. MM6662-R1]|uniref:hypothetical protein n=1 Tax=Paraburkholderia sp. MM6662-R1 TaxID=2991066 RepID=UPI003D1DBC69
MTVAARTASLEALTPYLGMMRTLCMDSWADYGSRYSDTVRAIHNSTTRANIVHDHWVDRAARFAEATEGADLVDVNRLKVLVIGSPVGVFAIRMKKMDGELRTANVSTGQVRDFKNQEQLDGMPGACHLELGYTLNSAATEIDAVYLVCPSGEGIAWSLRLLAESVETVMADLYEQRLADETADEDEGAILLPRRPAVVEEDLLDGTTLK